MRTWAPDRAAFRLQMPRDPELGRPLDSSPACCRPPTEQGGGLPSGEPAASRPRARRCRTTSSSTVSTTQHLGELPSLAPVSAPRRRDPGVPVRPGFWPSTAAPRSQVSVVTNRAPTRSTYSLRLYRTEGSTRTTSSRALTAQPPHTQNQFSGHLGADRQDTAFFFATMREPASPRLTRSRRPRRPRAGVSRRRYAIPDRMPFPASDPDGSIDPYAAAIIGLVPPLPNAPGQQLRPSADTMTTPTR